MKNTICALAAAIIGLTSLGCGGKAATSIKPNVDALIELSDFNGDGIEDIGIFIPEYGETTYLLGQKDGISYLVAYPMEIDKKTYYYVPGKGYYNPDSIFPGWVSSIK